MAHTFLSLDVNLIPQETKDNVPNYNKSYFSNDHSRILLDGYNESGELVHSPVKLYSWLQWSSDPATIILNLLLDAVEYTTEDLMVEIHDTGSIWYHAEDNSEAL